MILNLFKIYNNKWAIKYTLNLNYFDLNSDRLVVSLWLINKTNGLKHMENKK